ncbi:DUF6946 family protein [Pseudomonadota bacterium]
MPNILVPSAGPGDWKALLADPELHWARGRSARSLAHCWEDGDGFPPEIKIALSKVNQLADVEPMLIFPEWKVPLPGGHTASQNDVWILGRVSVGLISIAIEGKVDESFDKTLGKWKEDASQGKRDRLDYLNKCLGLSKDPPDHIYYQLMHRTVSAVIEAKRFEARAAVMLVHSFSSTDQWFDEFAEFCKLFDISASVGTIGETTCIDGMPLFLGWVHGDERFLTA